MSFKLFGQRGAEFPHFEIWSLKPNVEDPASQAIARYNKARTHLRVGAPQYPRLFQALKPPVVSKWC